MKLQEVIAPLFYDDRDGWVRVMRHAIALNGSFFNTDRSVRQYVQHAYAPMDSPRRHSGASDAYDRPDER